MATVKKPVPDTIDGPSDPSQLVSVRLEDVAFEVERKIEKFSPAQNFTLSDLARIAEEPPTNLHYLYTHYQLFGPPPGQGRGKIRFSILDLKKALLAVELKRRGNTPKQIKALLVSTQQAPGPYPSTVVPVVRAGMDFVQRVQVQAKARLMQLIAQKLCSGEILRDGLIILNRINVDSDNAGLASRQATRPSMEEVETLIRLYKQVPVGWSTAEGEVFTVLKDIVDLTHRLSSWDLYRLPINDPTKQRLHEVILGISSDSSDPQVIAIRRALTQFPQSPSDGAIQYLISLMDVMFDVIMRLEELEELTRLPVKAYRLMSQGDALSVLANAIVQISSDKWDYCGIILPFAGDPSSLHVAAASVAFPPALRERALYPIPHSLPGWVHISGEPLVINEVVERDPRILFYGLERPSAVAVLPAEIGAENKGVVYIGTRRARRDNEPAFTDIDLKVLGAFAQIVGEIIGRQLLNDQVVTNALRLSSLSSVPRGNSSEFREALCNDLSGLASNTKDDQDMKDGLLILAVRIVNYDELKMRGSAVASWAAERVCERVGRFLEARQIAHSRNRPIMYKLHDDRYVALLNRVGPDFKDLRDELSVTLEKLGNLGMTLKVETVIWSLYFAYADLNRRFNLTQPDTNAIPRAVEMLFDRTSGALNVLTYIRQGDGYLRTRNYQKAKGQFELARYNDPENPYHVRHLAECLIGLGDYDEAIEISQAAAKMDENYPGSHRRLAEAYVGKGAFDLAFKHFDKAIELNPSDPMTHMRYGQALRLKGDAQSVKRAREHFLEAMSLDQQTDKSRARYYRLVAQTWARAGDHKEAVDSFQQALGFDPDNEDLIADLELAIADLAATSREK